MGTNDLLKMVKFGQNFSWVLSRFNYFIFSGIICSCLSPNNQAGNPVLDNQVPGEIAVRPVDSSFPHPSTVPSPTPEGTLSQTVVPTIPTNITIPAPSPSPLTQAAGTTVVTSVSLSPPVTNSSGSTVNGITKSNANYNSCRPLLMAPQILTADQSSGVPVWRTITPTDPVSVFRHVVVSWSHSCQNAPETYDISGIVYSVSSSIPMTKSIVAHEYSFLPAVSNQVLGGVQSASLKSIGNADVSFELELPSAFVGDFELITTTSLGDSYRLKLTVPQREKIPTGFYLRHRTNGNPTFAVGTGGTVTAVLEYVAPPNISSSYLYTLLSGNQMRYSVSGDHILSETGILTVLDPNYINLTAKLAPGAPANFYGSIDVTVEGVALPPVPVCWQSGQQNFCNKGGPRQVPGILLPSTPIRFYDPVYRLDRVGIGAGWDVSLGSFSIRDYTVVANPSAVSLALARNVTSLKSDVYAFVSLGAPGVTSHSGVVLDYQGPGDSNMRVCLIVGDSVLGSNAEIWENVQGNWSKLASKFVPATQGLLRCYSYGSYVALNFNNEPVVATESSKLVPSANGRVGLRGLGGRAHGFHLYDAKEQKLPDVLLKHFAKENYTPVEVADQVLSVTNVWAPNIPVRSYNIGMLYSSPFGICNIPLYQHHGGSGVLYSDGNPAGTAVTIQGYGCPPGVLQPDTKELYSIPLALRFSAKSACGGWASYYSFGQPTSCSRGSERTGISLFEAPPIMAPAF